MLRKKHEGLSWLEFSLLQSSQLSHGCFTRNGGVSPVPFHSLNFGSVEGHEDFRAENMRRIRSCIFGEISGDVLCMNQVHGTNIVVVDNPGLAQCDSCDAMMTHLQNVALVVKHADCQPCLMFDPVNQAIAVIHAGWRGCVAGMYHNVVRAMQHTYGSDPQQLIACVGPSLGPLRFEFRDWETLLPKSFHQFLVGSCHVDFWSATRHQLITAGLLEKNIEIASICTYDSPEDFFSYRRDGVTGRNGSYIALAPKKH
jgi:YfiH family protein